MTRLSALGWDEAFARGFAAAVADLGLSAAVDAGVEPARVAVEFNQNLRVATAGGEVAAVTAGRLKHRAGSRAELPAVGDWVALRRRGHGERGTIVAVLPRRTWFSRRMAGQVTDEQVVAANVDVILVVMGLDGDFSPRRLERYLLLARESGAAPVVVLTKPDLAADLEAQRAAVTAVAGAAPVVVANPARNEGVAALHAWLAPGRTAALLGSSGVGKSTIINSLVGEDVRRTREVRAADSRGRHTTTHRELVTLPGGGLVIDTPGMRELQLWDAHDAVRETFDDVDAWAAGCRFGDCRHRGEPGCAVAAAVAAGDLPAARLASYLAVREELAQLDAQRDERAMRERKRQGRSQGGGRRPMRPRGPR